MLSRVIALFLASALVASPANAQFAIFQAAAAPPTAASCNIATGVATGLGAGTCIAHPATCNGVADDSQAFIDFNTWVRGTWQPAFGAQLIQLVLPAGNCMVSGNTVTCGSVSTPNCPFIGIKNLIVTGQGLASTTLTGASGQFLSLGGIGLRQNNTHSARTASASVGATCVTLLTPAQSSLFTVGNPVEMAGLDTQEIWGSPFGFPPNPSFWDYLFVASVDAAHQCDGVTSGASVHFTTPLTSQYLSTWPNYNSGNAFEIDPGGPATLYALDPTWDAAVEFVGMTIKYPSQIYATNRSVKYTNVLFGTSSGCAIPTENATWSAIGSDFRTCGTVEIDKIIDNMIATNDQFTILQFQSASVKQFAMNNSTATQQQGSPIAQTGAGNTFSTTLKVGATSFGRSKSFACTGCSIASFSAPGIKQNSLGSYPMTAGVIKFPNGSTVTGIANSASSPGSAALVVMSSAGWITGQTGLISTGSNLDGTSWVFTVDDATHITLNGSTYTGQTGSGYVCRADAPGSYCAAPWAVPGANIVLEGAGGVVEALGQITDVTQDATFTYVATTFTNYPADVTALATHPAPVFTLTGSTSSGDAQVPSLAQAPPGAPLYSFQTYPYPGTIGTTVQTPFIMWGLATRLDINVTAPSSGVSTFKLSQFDNWPVYVSGSQTTYGTSADAHVVADHNLTPAGTWFGGASNSGAQYTVNPGASASVTVTMQTSQGVVP